MSPAQWRLKTWLILIVVLAVPVYAGTLRNDFVDFDDPVLIVQNDAVHELSTRTLHYVFTTFDPELYIPLTLVSYQLDWQFFGLAPWGVHLTNLLLHILSVMAVGWVAMRITERRATAVVAAALFAFHPINAQAVLWASARKDLLSSFFCLLAFGMYLRFRETRGKGAYFTSLILFLCALLSKVSVALFPIVLFLTDWMKAEKTPVPAGSEQGAKRRVEGWKEKIPFLLLSAILIIVAFIGKAQALESSDMRTNILLGVKSIAFYLFKLFVPVGFSIIHPQEPLATAPLWPFVLSAFVVGVLLLLAVLGIRRCRTCTWGIAFFLFLVVPTFTNFFQSGQLYFAYDRYAYLPLVGVFIVLAQEISRLLDHRRFCGATVVLLSFAILFLAGSSWRQVGVWRNSETLFRHVLTLYPDSAVAHGNLGVTLASQNRPDEALSAYRAALRADPGFVFAYFNMSQVLRSKGEYERSQRFLETAMQIVRGKQVVVLPDLLPFFLYAERQQAIGRGDAALRALEEAVRLAPSVAVTHFNLGVLYHKYGRSSEALRELEAARAIQPRNADMQYHLASLYAEQGMLQEAKTALEWVLWLHPAYPNAREHMENIRRLMAG